MMALTLASVSWQAAAAVNLASPSSQRYNSNNLQEPGVQQQQQVLTQVNSRQSCCLLAVGMLQQLPLQLPAV
jgi:hypothetical protein